MLPNRLLFIDCLKTLPPGTGIYPLETWARMKNTTFHLICNKSQSNSWCLRYVYYDHKTTENCMTIIALLIDGSLPIYSQNIGCNKLKMLQRELS